MTLGSPGTAATRWLTPRSAGHFKQDQCARRGQPRAGGPARDIDEVLTLRAMRLQVAAAIVVLTALSSITAWWLTVRPGGMVALLAAPFISLVISSSSSSRRWCGLVNACPCSS